MKLYVCYGTFEKSPIQPDGKHPCGKAFQALRDAGHDPEVKRAYGWNKLPDALVNWTPGRRRAKDLTGSTTVPVLELEDGTAVSGSAEIVRWAQAHPAGRAVA
jgi:Glutathione S-transferase, N-terminal domain